MNTAPVLGGTRVQDPLRHFWESVQVQVETEWGIAASCGSCHPIPVRQQSLRTSFSTSEPRGKQKMVGGEIGSARALRTA